MRYRGPNKLTDKVICVYWDNTNAIMTSVQDQDVSCCIWRSSYVLKLCVLYSVFGIGIRNGPRCQEIKIAFRIHCQDESKGENYHPHIEHYILWSVMVVEASQNQILSSTFTKCDNFNNSYSYTTRLCFIRKKRFRLRYETVINFY